MSTLARELEAFFNQNSRPDLANKAGGLVVEAVKLEAGNRGALDVRQSQIELPGGIRKEHLKPKEPLSKEAFATSFTANGIDAKYAQLLIDVITLTDEAPDLELAWPSGKDLGLTRSVPYMRFLEAGEERGYQKLHPEVALYLRLFDLNQPRGIYWVAMDPIVDRHGGQDVFALVRHGGGLWLYAGWPSPDDLWRPESRLVFSASMKLKNLVTL